MTLRNVDAQSIEIKRKTIRRIFFIVTLIAAAGGSDLNTVDLKKVDVSMKLYRDKETHVLFQENLKLLAKESMYFDGFEYASGSGISITDTKTVLPLCIDLGTALNVTQGDTAEIEVTTKDGWMGNFDASKSFIEVDEREYIGIETAIPFILTKPINATNERFTASLGDNVVSLTLLNLENGRTQSDADHVFDNLQLTTDRYNLSDNYGRILTRRSTQFPSAALAAARKQCFKIVPETELDGVQVVLGLKAENVASSENYVVYRVMKPTRTVLERAQAYEKKHQNRNANKLATAIA